MPAPHTLYLTIGENRGAPRLYICSDRLREVGLDIGASYVDDYDEASQRVSLRPAAAGGKTVSRKRRGEAYSPLVELKSARLSMLGIGGRVTVTITRGRVDIALHHVTRRIRDRLSRLRGELSDGVITTAEVCAGGGVMADALHQGLADRGLQSRCRFVVERESAYVASLMRNCRAVGPDTAVFEGGLQEVDLQQLPKVSVLSAGLPCTAASLAGRAKRGGGAPELDPEVGHLVLGFVQIISATSPYCVVLENVCSYANTASYAMLKRWLGDNGYTVAEVTLTRELGAFEDRRRLCMVASTPGADITLDRLEVAGEVPGTLGELLDEIPDDSPKWRRYHYLDAKQERDAEKVRAAGCGTGFAQQIMTADSRRCPTITKSYQRVRSTDPRLAHPSGDGRIRQLSVAEHARIKGVPFRMVEGQSELRAHEILGQGVIYAAIRSVGRRIADTAQGFGRALGREANAARLPSRQHDIFASI